MRYMGRVYVASTAKCTDKFVEGSSNSSKLLYYLTIDGQICHLGGWLPSPPLILAQCLNELDESEKWLEK